MTYVYLGIGLMRFYGGFGLIVWGMVVIASRADKDIRKQIKTTTKGEQP